MSKRRQARIADVVQRELSDIVWRRIKDPRLEGLTITGTRISADYMYADIYFYRLGGDQEDLEEAREGLESASGFIRRELGARLRTRFTPELRFHLDESIDYGDHIDSLLHQIQQERQREAEETAADASGDAGLSQPTTVRDRPGSSDGEADDAEDR